MLGLFRLWFFPLLLVSPSRMKEKSITSPPEKMFRHKSIPTMRKRPTIFFFLCLFLSCHGLLAQDCTDISWASIADSGPYEVATLEEETDSLRNGDDYDGATIYYPVDALAPLASVVIVPGFLANPSSVENWGPFYASHGILAMIIGTNSPTDNPEDRANGLLDALETLRQENNRDNSPLNGQIDSLRFAVSGWSMGGGGAQRAAVLDSNRIKAVVALCPWLPAPALNHPVPVLIFGGQLDVVAPPGSHANPHYAATPASTDKLKFIVDDGGHQVANDPEGGDGDVGKMALSWLRYYLLDDPCYCPLLLEEPGSASDYTSNIVCDMINSTDSPNELAEAPLVLYPNPTQGYLTVVNAPTETQPFEVFNLLGERLQQGFLNSEQVQLDLSPLPTALYLLRIGKELYRVQKL